ncbi:ABC transporter permease [Erythrobacter crassostreae]|uniref:FtsX-like permease family protein n=1 Tax=Erythrobacter crassostreae TaxID=2828328 RepID=A0A9X1F6S9_9SPHN|nr:ABC transporter permease [Erythrobacter crassostrea]MBV7260313.1 FtsX-like permease family protein [Erythrobacter crassostrea]
MTSQFRQFLAVSRIILASVPKRLWVALSMVVAIAMVVFVLLGALALDKGMQATLDRAGADDVVVILSEGASSEASSGLTKEQYSLLAEAPGIATSGNELLISYEFVVAVDGIKRSTGTEVNLPLRGIDPAGAALRTNFNIVEGRNFEPGSNEIVVGKHVIENFDGFALGEKTRLGASEWEVVGVFETGGSVYDTEMWADRLILQNLFNRGDTVQSVRAKIDNIGSIEGLKNFIEEDPRLNATVSTETEFFASQSEAVSDLITMIGRPLAILMSFGALAGAVNAAFNSVSQRSVEIATLRTIGFGRSAVFFGTLAEIVVLGVVGGAVGVLFSLLIFNGLSASTLGSNFTQIVFELRLTWREALTGVTWALALALLGGVYPAWQAARKPIREILA